MSIDGLLLFGFSSSLNNPLDGQTTTHTTTVEILSGEQGATPENGLWHSISAAQHNSGHGGRCNTNGSGRDLSDTAVVLEPRWQSRDA